MQAVIEMAKAHLSNVAAKINDLEKQKTILQEEIEKLKSYFNDGVANVEAVTNQSTDSK
jgi:hypothetical protein